MVVLVVGTPVQANNGQAKAAAMRELKLFIQNSGGSMLVDPTGLASDDLVQPWEMGKSMHYRA
jgi:hypothetical protein